jgi:hypothetical protein
LLQLKHPDNYQGSFAAQVFASLAKSSKDRIQKDANCLFGFTTVEQFTTGQLFSTNFMKSIGERYRVSIKVKSFF